MRWGSAHAATLTFRCTNPKSATTWEVIVDYDRSTADSFPTEISGSQIVWHGTLHGGYYYLDRASGAPRRFGRQSEGAARSTISLYVAEDAQRSKAAGAVVWLLKFRARIA
jgi:hypothetical protein